MEFGADFDDDFFEKPKERQLNGPANYEPKVFKPFWFMEVDLKGKETSEVLVALKHQADHHYLSKTYAKAAEAYERCLTLVPSSNVTWKREFMENLARAHLKMDQPEKALKWSFKLDKSSCNADQKIVSMNLLAAVCHRLGKYAEELEALHCCLEAHKLCPEFWQRLALCYAGLFKLYLPEYSIRRPPSEELEEPEEPCCDFKSRMNSRTPSVEGSSPQPNSSLVCPAEGGPSGADECSEEVCSTKCELCILGIQIVSSCLIRTRSLLLYESAILDHCIQDCGSKYTILNHDGYDDSGKKLGGSFTFKLDSVFNLPFKQEWRMLIDSGGPNHLTAQRDERLKEKIANSLKHMEVDQDFIDVASQMLGGDFSSILQRPDGTLEEHSSLLNHTDHTNDV